MTQQTFIVGNREFTCQSMNAFDANRILMRLQKVIVPVFGSLMGGNKSLGDVDVKVAAGVIAEHLDESIMDNIVLPMFDQSRVYCNDSKQFIKSGMDINKCFTTDNLFDFYELTFEVARFQFSPFLSQLMERFTSLTDDKTKA